MVNTTTESSIKPGLSVVFICKNAAADFRKAIESILPLSDDIVVYDSGSTDETLSIAKEYPVNIIQGEWKGFGKTRRMATGLAKYDWVFCMDTDEIAGQELLQAINAAPLDDIKVVYRILLKNFIGPVELHHGGFSADYRIRIFNRKVVNWDDAYIHEKLRLPIGVKVKTLSGSLRHKTAASVQDYHLKLERYARMTADKHFQNGKKAGLVKYYLSPAFSFVKNYFFRLGILEGKMGLSLAKAIAHYTKMKYRHLRQLKKRA